MIKNRKLIMTLLGAFILSSLTAAEKTQAASGTSLLEQTSKAFTQIGKKAMPATVFIKATLTQTQQEFENPFDMGDDFFRRFFGGQQFSKPQPQEQVGVGSGFFISPNGYIATNYHVIKEANQITVVMNDGREFTASVSGTDPRTDLALLKVEGTDFPFIEFGDSDDLDIGEWVVAIGNPFALESSLTVGVVSAKGRQDLGIAALEDFIQTDAAINPGNSGGALLNLRGEVIGVNTAIMTRSGGYMGIGLAIPSKMAKHVFDQIIDGGSVKRAYLGVILQPVDKDLAEAMSLEKQEGILISDVVKGSPADKAGLKQGDIVLAYNDKPVKNISKFRNDIALLNPGSEIKLKILRSGKTLTITASTGTQTEGEVISAEMIQKIGLEVDNLTPELASRLGYGSDTEGVVITKVKPGSPAAQAGLKPYGLIIGVAVNWDNQKKVSNVAEFEEAIKAIGNKKHIILIARYRDFQRYYTLRIN
ncbi:MAG: DegQ family serine endoprotease [Verrucomicrobia bacterium]|nr:DegQ family serine endoprotease [Verrucomicrobiota bacterium]